MGKTTPFIAALAVIIGCSPIMASACPDIGGVVDFNCDRTVKIAITGDSIVKGVGDSHEEGEGIGYPGRLQTLFPRLTIKNVGVAGITSMGLLRAYMTLLPKENRGNTRESVEQSDIIVISVGVNDYFNFQSPALTVRNITRLVSYLRRTLKKRDGGSPFIAVATLLPSTRPFQQPFIAAVNALLVKMNSNALPVFVRFDHLNRSGDILNLDGLHPNARGYDRMTTIAQRTLRTSVRKAMLKERPDRDRDGVFDRFEGPLFGTDSSRADTDGDTLTDGDEIFLYQLDPTTVDTNGDGIRDDLQAVIPPPTPPPSAPSPTPGS